MILTKQCSAELNMERMGAIGWQGLYYVGVISLQDELLFPHAKQPSYPWLSS